MEFSIPDRKNDFYLATSVSTCPCFSKLLQYIGRLGETTVVT